MTSPDRQAAIDAILAAWNQGDFSRLGDHLTGDSTRVSPPSFDSDAGNLEELKQVIRDFRTQFPDAHVELRDRTEMGDVSISHWTFTGTNTGPGDFPPTGRSVEIDGISVNHWQGEKIAQEEVYFDTMDFMSQLGLVEAPA
ncbi:MAG TPA: ester cyclase [Longimicrobiales bacterium]|nr:ester cyclase [Longimicrobiales bacterium]